MTSSPAPEPRVSIILPCRNEARGIEMCIASVLAQEPPPGEFEVIIADGMSDDGTREILARLAEEVASQLPAVTGPGDPLRSSLSASDGERGGVRRASSFVPSVPSPLRVPADSNFQLSKASVIRVIDNPSRIVSTGLNAAIRMARGDIIIRLDAHTEYASDYLCACVKALERTGADNVGGPARTRANTVMQSAVAAAYHSPFAVGGAHFHDVNYQGYVDTVTYGCWPRSTFEKFGLFDEELVRNQDDEHNLRITRGGGKVYQSPKIRSWYRPRGSLIALFKQYMQYGYWKVRVIQKHKLPASIRHLVPGAFVLALMLLFLLSAFRFLLSTLGLAAHFSFLISAFNFFPAVLLVLLLSV